MHWVRYARDTEEPEEELSEDDTLQLVADRNRLGD
jgi:hypothetical protein